MNIHWGVSGVWLACVGCAAGGPLGGELDVGPAVVDFGAIAVGAVASEDIVLRNESGRDATVLSMDIDAEGTVDAGAWFSVDGALPLVPAGGVARLPVRYAPGVEGFFLARLTLVTDGEADNVHAVDLRGAAGTPGAQIWPLVVDFGPVVGTGTRELTLANDGGVDLVVTAAVVEGGGFALATPLPVELPVGATTTLGVEYAGGDAAEVTSTLRLGLSGGAAVATVTLRANACTTGDAAAYDTDGDGFSGCASDCDDGDAQVRPGAREVCDGIDQDCDGEVDEGTTCADDDGDGVTEDGGDCNDGDPAVSSGAVERADNGVDDDCDGVVDRGSSDLDGDGYAGADAEVDGGDCAPDDASVYPGAPETADGVDEDCDGVTDEGTAAWDGDGDGWTEIAGDCDPGDADVSPSERERANGVDDDCDGRLDEGTDAADDDGDGFTEDGGDCDDADAAVSPAAAEIAGDGTDQDCDGVVA